MSRPNTTPRRALVTGASGYIGGALVPRLLQEGWTVRVLTRRTSAVADHPWADQVEVHQGDASRAEDLAAALAEVEVGYYLIHSMDGRGDFRARDRALARSFGQQARRAGVRRLVYLSGLHPDGDLSPHLASRVEVGQTLLDSGVPTAVLQAAVVLGDGSASFDMLRHLTERLPVMVAPRWLHNRVQPIAIEDVLDDLVGAADLAPEHNRTFDIGGPDVLSYAEMIRRYAAVAGLRPRLIVTVPVLTPELASRWVGFITPLSSGLARPLVASLVHEMVCQENDLADLIGRPGQIGYEQAVGEALRTVEPVTRQERAVTVAVLGVAAAVTVPIVAWTVVRRLRGRR